MNLFQQAMYRGRPQPHQNAAMTGDDIRNTMCEQGIVGVKAGSMVHSGRKKKVVSARTKESSDQKQ